MDDSEHWTWTDVEQRGQGPIWGTILEFAWKDLRKPQKFKLAQIVSQIIFKPVISQMQSEVLSLEQEKE
jgi:hypothetical protein